MTYENDEIEALFEQLDSNKTEEELIAEDSYGLQASFLSEIERLSRQHGFNRKELAAKIKTSPSYLTQVFRGDKPLNFLTLAKINRALDIRFDVKACLYSETDEKEINKELNLFSIKTDTIPLERRDEFRNRQQKSK